jgi:hypothetical protein
MDPERVRLAVEQLHYDWRQFTLEDFIRHVERCRGRTITIIGVPLEEFSGICISMGARDYIFFDTHRHPALQLHAQLHEIAHLVLDHSAPVQYRSLLSPLEHILLHVNTRQHRLRSDARMQQEEDEAEYFAFLIQRAVADSRRLHELTLSDAADDVHLPPFTGEFFTRS